jgi:hypothetical protein
MGIMIEPINTLDVGGCMAVGVYAGNDDAPENGMIVSGNVGIGVNDPSGILDVDGGTASSGDGTNITLNAQDAASGGNGDGGNIIILPGDKDGTGNNGGVGIGTATPQGAFSVDNTGESKGLGVSFDTYHQQIDYDDDWQTIATISTEDDKAYGITLNVVGIKTDASEAAHYIRIGSYYNDDGTLSSIAGSELTVTRTAEVDTTWDIQVIISNTNILVQVKVGSGDLVEWQTTVEKHIVGI